MLTIYLQQILNFSAPAAGVAFLPPALIFFFVGGWGSSWLTDRFGMKPVLVLSNSLGMDFSMWDPQVPEFVKSFRVLRYDTRGHGQSSVTPGPYSIRQLAGDVLEYPDPILGRMFRAEHHMHAQWTGHHVGKAMIGEEKAYAKVPYFFSDIGELSMIFRGDPVPTKKSFIVGDEQAPRFTEIFVDDSGVIRSMVDLRRDFKEQEPIRRIAAAPAAMPRQPRESPR